ncbi:phosphonate ABC transporter ATP-binding protein [bacterium]|nr:phosphonate ABC transporter ATP-binding protein [bacterium]
MVRTESLTKIYDDGTVGIKDLSVDVTPGKLTSVIGPSGAGKSTFLRCINRLINPTSGKVFLGDIEITALNQKELVKARRRIGFIFQQFNLVERLTVLENVLAGRIGYHSLARTMFGSYPKEEVEMVTAIIDEVGLLDKIHTRVDNLSGGQQQRVGIARAVAQEPDVILADEPLASLDPKLSHQILGLLKQFNEKYKITVLLNIHDLEFAKIYSDYVLGLKKGEKVFWGPLSELSKEKVEFIYK